MVANFRYANDLVVTLYGVLLEIYKAEMMPVIFA